jgi:hypothetical protein
LSFPSSGWFFPAPPRVLYTSSNTPVAG